MEHLYVQPADLPIVLIRSAPFSEDPSNHRFVEPEHSEVVYVFIGVRDYQLNTRPSACARSKTKYLEEIMKYFLILVLLTGLFLSITAQPNYEFVTNPTNIITTYYDYQPGSYNGIPMQVQPETSQPNGYSAGGVYLVYHAQETIAANRRAFFSYIDPNGDIITTATISSENLYDGYLGMDIDPVTADPFVAWHVDVDADDLQEILFSFDFYHAAGGAGLWNDPAIVIDNGNMETPHPDDKFIWPFVNIGPSPQGAEYRRVYVTATNATDHGNGSAHNPMIAYADFTTDDLDNMTPFEWTYNTIPQLDEWDSDDPEIYTQSKLAFVSSKTDGKVAFIGWNVGHGFFVFLNENYGEGEYTFYHDDFKKYVDNPQNQDGTYRFADTSGVPYEGLNYFFRYNGYFNADFIDSESKISFIGNMGLQVDNPDSTGTLYWGYSIYPKQFYFDLASTEFKFVDVYPQGANPTDDQPMLPWDLDEDGVPDNYDDNGIVQFEEGWPFFYHLSAASNNIYKFAKNDEKGWLAAVWHDGVNAKHANNEDPGYEEWLDVPEIAIAVSADNGASWSDPIFMNANANDENYVPEFDGMIPCYINPGDIIEDLGEDEFGNSHGKLHLFFLDDNSYGSFVLGHGLENGGMLKYAALDIEFPDGSAAGEFEIDQQNLIILQNYPNPFNSQTTISFQLNAENTKDTEIIIYNIKGQKVNSFPNLQNEKSSNQQIVWDGKDETGKQVKSGIYFSNLRLDGKIIQIRKMILMR